MIKVDLSGRAAVIVGSGGELDAVLVREFLDSGAQVALCRKPGLQPHVTALGNTDNFNAFDLDLSDFSSIPVVFDRVIQRFGKVDILVNNPMGAFLDTERVPLHEVNLDQFIQMTNEWLKGLMRFAKLCSADMSGRKSGNIVNIVSVRGLTNVADQSITVAVSAALHGLTRMWGVEMHEYSIRANCAAVGVLQDEPELPCGNAVRFSHANIKRPCSAEEAASAVLFLASDASSYITGTVIPVDGGISAGLARSF